MPDRLAVRRGPLVARDVIFAPERGNRPRQHSVHRPAAETEKMCPFCPGNEAMLQDILWQEGDCGVWLTRAVTNLYPVVSPPAGHHEVIIDTPRHSLPAGEMTVENWRRILTAYGTRYPALLRQWRYVSLFRNVGERAAASLDHPHSQLIALARTPGQILARHRRLRRACKTSGRCALCRMIDTVGATGDRLVMESASHIAMVPEKAEVPFEVWVVPIAHSSTFSADRVQEMNGLADTLCDVFHRMDAVLGDFDHNMMLMDSAAEAQRYLHWFFRVRPALGPAGGFELMTEVSVNPSRPDRDAATLREAAPLRRGARHPTQPSCPAQGTASSGRDTR